MRGCESTNCFELALIFNTYYLFNCSLLVTYKPSLEKMQQAAGMT
jgi:hypothetical protein